jgi:hypothetical protein
MRVNVSNELPQPIHGPILEQISIRLIPRINEQSRAAIFQRESKHIVRTRCASRTPIGVCDRYGPGAIFGKAASVGDDLMPTKLPIGLTKATAEPDLAERDSRGHRWNGLRRVLVAEMEQLSSSRGDRNFRGYYAHNLGDCDRIGRSKRAMFRLFHINHVGPTGERGLRFGHVSHADQ